MFRMFSLNSSGWRTSREKVKIILFAIAVIIRLVLMGIFTSDYQSKMFVPFVSVFLDGHNPYEYYYENDLLESFPYFPVMLLIESVGEILIRMIPVSGIFFNNVLFKMPLLVFDCIGYVFLRKTGVCFKYTYVFYFCSPIILYGTYMHGQLDVIPTTLLIIAIYYLLKWKQKNNLCVYALFLGLAMAAKLHILAAVPILFIYVLRKRGLYEAVKYHVLSILIVLGITIPFWGQGFIHIVLMNKEQLLLMSTYIDYGATGIIIPIFILLVIYFSVFELGYFNRNLLLSMLALLFAVFLISIPPMPGWFIWIVHFLVLYFANVEEDKHKLMIVYALFNIVYFVYFIFLHQTEFVDLYLLDKSLQRYKLNVESVKYAVFTVMEVCLSIIIYNIYKFGIATNSLYQRRKEAFVIGIAGDSAAGKSKMLRKMECLFGLGKDMLFVEGDGDHRWERGDENWKQYTALNPQANFLYRQAEDIKRLKSGIQIQRIDYDHYSGSFTEYKRISPKKFIVLSGLHSLYLPKLRNVLDLKIYMDTDENLRIFWKLQRDVNERGYAKDKVLEQIKKRYHDAVKYIHPQKSYADMVVKYFDKTLTDPLDISHNVKLSVLFEINMDFDVEPIITDLKAHGIKAEWDVGDDFDKQVIIFDGEDLESSTIDLGELAERNIQHYEDFFVYEPQWGMGTEGIIQLMLLFVINERMNL